MGPRSERSPGSRWKGSLIGKGGTEDKEIKYGTGSGEPQDCGVGGRAQIGTVKEGFLEEVPPHLDFGQ